MCEDKRTCYPGLPAKGPDNTCVDINCQDSPRKVLVFRTVPNLNYTMRLNRAISFIFFFRLPTQGIVEKDLPKKEENEEETSVS